MIRKKRLLLGDNHRLFVDACTRLLEPEFDVVGVVTDGRALVRVANELQPDGVVLEVSLPQLSGLEAAGQMKRRTPSLKLIFTTANPDPEVAAEAFRRGASAYVLKQCDAAEFQAAIRAVMRGHSYLSPLLARETIEYLLRQPEHSNAGSHLTRREAEVLQLLAEGHSMKQVANIIAISLGTVAYHKYGMMKKLGIGSNAELLQYALRHHLAPSSDSWTITDSTGARSIERTGNARAY